MTEYVPLLELEIEEPALAGPRPHRYGFTTRGEPANIDPGDGRARRGFGPGLVSLALPSRTADLYAGTSSSPGSARVVVSLDYFDVFKLKAQRVRLQHIRGRMWWWRPGTTLAEAVQVWRGILRNPSVSTTSRTFSFDLAAGTREVDTVFPPGLIGDADRFDEAPEASRPQALPVIYGTNQKVPIYRVTNDPGLSPPAVGTNVRFIIAGHRVAADQTVTVADGQGFSVAGLTVNHAVDGRGQEYAYVDVSNAEPDWTDSRDLYVDEIVGWPGPGDNAGRRVVVDKLGDVLAHIVTTYGAEQFAELDRARIFGARSLLNRYTVGVVVNTAESGSILRFLKARIEGHFPVAFSYAAGRFGWDFAGIPPGDKPVGTITWRHNAHERGDFTPEVPIDAVRARFEVKWRADGYAAGPTRSYRRDETNSGPCKAALMQWRAGIVESIDAPDVVDETTAALLVEDQIRRLAGMRARASYIVDEPEWVRHGLFARIHVNDADYGWTAQRCLVEGITPQKPGRVKVDVVVEEPE